MNSTAQLRILTPYEPIDKQQLVRIDTKIRSINGSPSPTPVRLLESGVLAPTKMHHPLGFSMKQWFSSVEEGIRRIRKSQKDEQIDRHAKIIAIVPTFEREEDVNLTIESLLRQTRPIDLIVVNINGPGQSDAAYRIARLYGEHFDNVIVDRPVGLEGKVNALNWSYMRYVHFGDFDFVLGIDADIEADPDMVHHLETDILSRRSAGGVMARYGFKVPDDMTGKSRSLIYGQRHEFAMTGIKHQLRKDTSNILGGQATLFRTEALVKAAAITEGGKPGPWDCRSKVEDAQLTRTLQKLGYSAAISRKARAWTGLMFTPATLHKQRRKWQDGHLEDMLRDFHPWLDRQRWMSQIVLGWNLLSRVLFAALLVTSVALHMYLFVPLWLAPICLAILQSTLVAIKIPNRRFQEITRSLLFVPGEIYYLRTLSVWLDSVILVFLNRSRDGWKNQATAEYSKKKTAHIAWLVIALAVCLPTTALMLASSYLPLTIVTHLINGLWIALTVMTAISVSGMLVMILRIIRNFKSLQP